MFEILLRLVFSLAAVVGLMLLLARAAQRRFKGRPGSVVTVVHRQPISKNASVAVVTVGSRVLVLGATDHQVQMIAELDPTELVGVEDESVVAAPADRPTAPVALAPAGDDSLDVALPGLGHLVPVAARSIAPTSFADLLRAESSGAAEPAPAQDPVGSTAPQRSFTLVPRTGASRVDGPLAGSLLSPLTWRRAFDAVTGRAS